MAESPEQGYQEIVGLDITSQPGMAKLSYKPKIVIAGATIGQTPSAACSANNTGGLDYRFIISLGKVYYSTNDGETWVEKTGWTNSAFTGCFVYKNYFFLITAVGLDIMAISTQTITTAWQTFAGGTAAVGTITPAIWARDDKAYIGVGKQIRSILNVADAFNSGTATYNDNALDLPSNTECTCFEELGNQLLIGTRVVTAAGNFDETLGIIYPWDKLAASFGNPTKMKEAGVWAMLTTPGAGGTGYVTYIWAGTKGNIYVTNGSTTNFLRRIPLDYSDTNETLVYPNAVFQRKAKLYFGVSYQAGTISPLGVYSMNLDGTGCVCEHILSTGNTTTNLTIPVLLQVPGESFLIGRFDPGPGSTARFALEKLDTTTRLTGYTGYIKTYNYTIGEASEPGTASECEIILLDNSRQSKVWPCVGKRR